MLGDDLLRGALVYLGAMQPEYASTLTTWHESMEYQRLLRRGMVTPPLVEDIHSWLSHQDDTEVLFAIHKNGDHQLIGMCAVKDINWQAQTCGFWVGIGERSSWGHGYGRDAVTVLLKYIFMEMNLRRVGLEVMDYNPRARKVYEKLGFQLEATLREYGWRDGQYYDMHLMGLLRTEWEALHAGK